MSVYFSIIFIISFGDINECLSALHTCSPHAFCNNTKGSYSCTCKHGLAGNGRECKGKRWGRNIDDPLYTSWEFTGITKQRLQGNFKNLATFIILFKTTKGAGKPLFLYIKLIMKNLIGWEHSINVQERVELTW